MFRMAQVLFTMCLAINTSVFSQTEIWQQQNYCVGQTINSFPAFFTNSYPTMSEVIQLPDSSYRMYVNVQYFPGVYTHCIGYASSSDAINWNYEDTCFCGSNDTTARNYILGGPSVIKLLSGGYRMYYRTTEKVASGPSKYHVRSAFSIDGINFTQEGIRIDIQPYDVLSDFTLVGHGTYWQYPDSTFGGIFSGNPDTSIVQPSSLIYTSSADGLTWGNFTFLYQGHHDPIVLKKNNQYILYSMNLSEYMAKAVSNDGIIWPASTDSVSFLDTVNAPMLVNNTKRIGDVGGIVMPDNEIFLYTNFGTTTGPSEDIIRFTLTNPGIGIAENNSFSLEAIVFPVPVTDATVIEFELQDKIFLELTDNLGRIIFSKTYLNTDKINIGQIPMLNGIYFYRLITENGISSVKIIK